MPPVKGLVFNSLALTPVSAVKHKINDIDFGDDGDSQYGADVEDGNEVTIASLAATPTPATPQSDKATNVSDARLKQLKIMGHTDQAVADQLTKEGFRLQPKTVMARWRRLKAQMDKEADEKLDDELSDWHEGEDEQLERAYQAADIKFNKELEKLEENRWKNVRQSLASNLNKDKYTAKACKERYQALQDGTAELAIEKDPDQVGRARKRAARIAENKRLRKKAIDDAEFEIAEKKRIADEEKMLKFNHKLEVIKYREDRKAEKEELAALRRDAAKGREMQRKRRARALERVREEAAEVKRIKLAEDRVYRYYTGRALVRKSRGGWKTGRDEDSEEDEAMGYLDGEYGYDAASEPADSVMEEQVKETATKPKFEMPILVTKTTLRNPRSILNDEELEILLFQRKLKRRGPVEGQPEVVARIAAADKELKSDEINRLLEKYWVKTTGKMGVRLIRLQEADAKASAAGQEGLTVNSPDFIASYEGYHGKYRSYMGS